MIFSHRFKYSPNALPPQRRRSLYCKIIRNGGLFLTVSIRSPGFLAMPLSLLILSQGNNHRKLSLGLHGDQESPITSAWWGPDSIHGRRRVQYAELMLWGSRRKETRPLRFLFMQLMTFISAYLFSSAAEQGAEKPLQKISYNLGNISNAPSVTWLCDWKEHFIWRFAIFWCHWHYTITFPVIYHIVEYQDKFASPYIYHITGKYRDGFHQLLYTKWCPFLTGDIQLLFEDLSWTDSAPRGFHPQPLPYFEIEIFPLTSALPSKRKRRGLSAFCSRYSKWTENDAAAERLPSPWESERSAAKMGCFSRRPSDSIRKV